MMRTVAPSAIPGTARSSALSTGGGTGNAPPPSSINRRSSTRSVFAIEGICSRIAIEAATNSRVSWPMASSPKALESKVIVVLLRRASGRTSG